MLITKVSMLTGKKNQMDLPVSEADMKRWRGGALVQDVFPNLTPDQREFLMTGSTPEEWDRAFDSDEWDEVFAPDDTIDEPL